MPLLIILPNINACSQPVASNPPYIPAKYYDCLEVRPDKLHDIYYSNYGNASMANALYNEKMFVFKNIEVQDWMLAHLDEGWIWVIQISCFLADQCNRNYLQVGQRLDIIGYNLGPDEFNGLPSLTFIDCIVLPAGLIALPADSEAGPIIPGY